MGNCGENAVVIGRVNHDRVKTQPARAGLPAGAGLMAAQTGEFMPVPAAVGSAEQSGVFNARVHCVGIVKRGFQVPDPGDAYISTATRRTPNHHEIPR